MIKRIGFKNIRLFQEEQWFDLKPLTILTGPNSSGKSIIQKMMILLSNSFKTNNNRIDFEYLEFNDEVFDKVGGFKSLVSADSNDPGITIGFGYESELLGEINCRLYYEQGQLSRGELTKLDLSLPEFNGEFIMVAERTYVKQDREGNATLTNRITNEMRKYPYLDSTWDILGSDEVLSKRIQTIHNAMLKVKNKAIFQKRLVEISNKFKQKEAFSESENILINEMKQNGIELKDEFDEFGLFSSKLGSWFDINKREELSYSEKLEEVNEFIDTSTNPVLLKTKVSDLVLGENNLLSDDINNENNELKARLGALNILTKDDFIKRYQQLEQNILFVVLKQLNKSKQIDMMGDDFWKNYPQFFEFVKPKELYKNLYTNLIENFPEEQEYIDLFIEINSLKVQLRQLSSDEIKQILNITDSDPVSKGKTSSEEEKSSIDVFLEIFLGEFNNLNIEISQFISSINIIQQSDNHFVKRHYLSSEFGIQNSSLYQLGLEIVNNNRNKFKLDYINKWLQNLNIAEELLVFPIKIDSNTKTNQSTLSDSGEILGVSFSLMMKDGSIISLGDNGLGVNLLILLLVKLQAAITLHKPIILFIEEPESHLHPNLQSKLTDIFLDAVKINHRIRLIAETHSTYLTQRLQYHVSRDSNAIQKCKIYYLNSRDIQPRVKEMRLKKNGLFIDEFGSGFYDESTILALDILKGGRS